MDPRDAGHPRQMLLVDALEVRDVACDHLQMIVIAARHQVAGHHVGTTGDCRFECGEIFLALLFQRDGNDNRRDEAERRRFEIGPIAANDAGFLELTNATRAGGRRQADLFGELDLACPCIGEQLRENRRSIRSSSITP